MMIFYTINQAIKIFRTKWKKFSARPALSYLVQYKELQGKIYDELALYVLIIRRWCSKSVNFSL